MSELAERLGIASDLCEENGFPEAAEVLRREASMLGWAASGELESVGTAVRYNAIADEYRHALEATIVLPGLLHDDLARRLADAINMPAQLRLAPGAPTPYPEADFEPPYSPPDPD
jgi:hypothetical protein